jgi:acetylornithine deacetylase/succinyl-diaminopimelate desuccinylase-like protein
MQVGEKANRNFELTVTNPGGHSSTPVDDNAIYQLSDALARVRAYKFPVRLNATTRAFLERGGPARKDALGEAMTRLARDPSDRAAEAVLARDRSLNSCSARPASQRCWRAARHQRPPPARQGDGQLPHRAG